MQLENISRQSLMLLFCHHVLRKLQQEVSQNSPSLTLTFSLMKNIEKNTDLVSDSLSFCVCVLNYLQSCGFPGAGPHTSFLNASSMLLCLPEICSTNISHKLQELWFWMTLLSDKGDYFSKSTDIRASL